MNLSDKAKMPLWTGENLPGELYENKVETVQQYWLRCSSCYSNTLIGWHYELKKIIWNLDAFLNIKQAFTNCESSKQSLAFTRTYIVMIPVAFIKTAASFSVECRSKWGPTGKNPTKKTYVSVHTSAFTNMSRSQTCKCFSRNKYTKSGIRKMPIGLTAFDKSDTNS